MKLARIQWFLSVSLATILCMTLVSVADAQFGVGPDRSWSQFQDPLGRFTLDVPPGWSYQADQSDFDFHLFFGPGDYDLFYLEVLPAATGDTPTSLASNALSSYSSAGGLRDFAVISQPSAGTLGGRAASFIVYGYTESGTGIYEGRSFVVVGQRAYSLAFADEAARFESSVATFNRVMASLTIHEETTPAGFGFGLAQAAEPEEQLVQGAQVRTTSPQPQITYTSPEGQYRFTLPESWELWEEQSTARGEMIEPWNGVFEWGNRPMTKSLFIWDHFDEWEQTYAQYEIVLGVIENLPGTQNEAIEQLKGRVTGENAHIYTTATSRVRVGAEPAMLVRIVNRPGFVEPWSLGSPWHKEVSFYVFKKGTTLFILTLPNEIVEHSVVTTALESFQWLAR